MAEDEIPTKIKKVHGMISLFEQKIAENHYKPESHLKRSKTFSKSHVYINKIHKIENEPHSINKTDLENIEDELKVLESKLSQQRSFSRAEFTKFQTEMLVFLSEIVNIESNHEENILKSKKILIRIIKNCIEILTEKEPKNIYDVRPDQKQNNKLTVNSNEGSTFSRVNSAKEINSDNKVDNGNGENVTEIQTSVKNLRKLFEKAGLEENKHKGLAIASKQNRQKVLRSTSKNFDDNNSSNEVYSVDDDVTEKRVLHNSGLRRHNSVYTIEQRTIVTKEIELDEEPKITNVRDMIKKLEIKSINEKPILKELPDRTSTPIEDTKQIETTIEFKDTSLVEDTAPLQLEIEDPDSEQELEEHSGSESGELEKREDDSDDASYIGPRVSELAKLIQDNIDETELEKSTPQVTTTNILVPEIKISTDDDFDEHATSDLSDSLSETEEVPEGWENEESNNISIEGETNPESALSSMGILGLLKSLVAGNKQINSSGKELDDSGYQPGGEIINEIENVEENNIQNEATFDVNQNNVEEESFKDDHSSIQSEEQQDEETNCNREKESDSSRYESGDDEMNQRLETIEGLSESDGEDSLDSNLEISEMGDTLVEYEKILADNGIIDPDENENNTNTNGAEKIDYETLEAIRNQLLQSDFLDEGQEENTSPP